jgi:hypothetical protein
MIGELRHLAAVARSVARRRATPVPTLDPKAPKTAGVADKFEFHEPMSLEAHVEYGLPMLRARTPRPNTIKS